MRVHPYNIHASRGNHPDQGVQIMRGMLTRGACATGLLLSAGVGLITAPAPAHADDECGPGPIVTCPAGGNFTATGVTYNTSVDFSLTTVPNSATVGLNVGSQGLNVTATGAANLDIDMSRGSVSGSGGVNLQTQSGDIAVSLRTLSVGNPLSIDSGSGDIVITFAAEVVPSGVAPGATLQAEAMNLAGNGLILDLASTQLPIGPNDSSYFSSNPALVGTVDFSGITGRDTVVIRAGNRWQATGNSVMSGGDSLVRIDAGGFLHTQLTVGGTGAFPSIAVDAPDLIDFGGGQNRIDNDGTIVVGASQYPGGALLIEEVQVRREGELRLVNLDVLHNAGDIYLGRFSLASNTGLAPTTDFWPDDILTLEGATFNGLAGSRLFVDVNLNSTTGQAGCDASLRDPDSGDLPAADCVNIKGGATEGRTTVVINDLVPGDRGAYIPDGITLVDVAGGVSAPGHFVIDPSSSSYSSSNGGVVDKGMFFFPLTYDADTQQHRLYGLPSQSAHQLPLLGHAAQSLWRDTSRTPLQRQSDIREALSAGGAMEGNAWAHSSRVNADREALGREVAGSSTYDFVNDHELELTSILLGRDFVLGADGDRAWMVGGMIGYGSADLAFEASPNAANLEGMVVGAYGGYVQGGFFIDALVNAHFLEADIDIPALGFDTVGGFVSGEVQSLGVDLNAGWRGWQAGPVVIEPLAGLSWVSVAIDDMRVAPQDPDPNRQGIDLRYEDPVSLRGSLGARLAAEGLAVIVPRMDLGLTVRYVEEFDGESRLAMDNIGPLSPTVSNTLDGGFVDVDGSVVLSDLPGNVAAILSVSGSFGDDYSSLGGSAGFRYRW